MVVDVVVNRGDIRWWWWVLSLSINSLIIHMLGFYSCCEIHGIFRCLIRGCRLLIFRLLACSSCHLCCHTSAIPMLSYFTKVDFPVQSNHELGNGNSQMARWSCALYGSRLLNRSVSLARKEPPSWFRPLVCAFSWIAILIPSEISLSLLLAVLFFIYIVLLTFSLKLVFKWILLFASWTRLIE